MYINRIGKREDLEPIKIKDIKNVDDNTYLFEYCKGYNCGDMCGMIIEYHYIYYKVSNIKIDKKSELAILELCDSINKWTIKVSIYDKLYKEV